ncbi:hypothetical protein OAG69_00175 [bacterium]|nr:hypothetical protein [bacterium]
MATPNIVPNSNNEGRLGRSGLQWLEVRGQSIYQNGNQVADLASPAFTGTPTAPTQASSDNSTKIATTAFVKDVLFSDGYPVFSAHADQRIPKYVSSTGQYEDSGYTSADFLNLANATGTLTSTGSLIGPTGVIVGSSDLQDDISDINTRLTTVEGSSFAPVSHTHVSADITDASTTGTPDVLVLRGPTGTVSGSNTAATGSAVEGSATGTQGAGVSGGNLVGSSGFGGYFISSATSSPGAGVVSEMTGSSTRPNFWGFGAGTGNFIEFAATAVSSALFYITKAAEIVWGVGANTKKIAPGTATGDRVATLPDATGTIVLGDGSGVTDAGSFRTAIDLGSSSDPEFATVAVDASTSSGLLFGSGGAMLALQSASSTTTYKLPSGGGSTENLVDGSGNGLDAPAFRTALGVLPSNGGTMTETLTINPSTGSDQLKLVGSGGNIGTITCNPGGPRTYTMPDGTGTLVLGNGTGLTDAAAFRTAIDAIQSGTVLSTDISNSTTLGRTLITAASAAAARTAIEVPQKSDVVGYAFASIDDTAFTGTSDPTDGDISQTKNSSVPVVIRAGRTPASSFLLNEASEFIVSGGGTSATLQYSSTTSNTFSVHLSVTYGPHDSIVDMLADELQISVDVDGTNVSGSVAKSIFSPPLTGHGGSQVYTGVNKTMHVSTHCIVDLSNGQNIKAMIQHMGATSTDRLDVKVHTLNMTITPLN